MTISFRMKSRGLLICLVVFFGILYFYTLPDFHAYDALAHARILKDPKLEELVNPHHLLPHVTMLGWDRLLRTFGYRGDYFFPSEILTIAAGIAGLCFFYGFLLKITRRPVWAFLVTLNLGVTYGFWFTAVEIENYSLNNLVVLAALFLVPDLLKTRPPGDSPQRALIKIFGMGLLLGFGGLFHQFTFLFTLSIGCVVLFDGKLCFTEKFSHLLVFGIGVILTGFVPYIILGPLLFQLRSPDEIISWMTLYTHQLPGFGKFANFYLAPLGIFETLFGTYLQDLVRNGTVQTPLQLLFAVLPGVIFAVLVARILIKLNPAKLFAEERSAFVALVSAFIIYAGFSACWDPVSLEMWQTVLPFFWGLVGLTGPHLKIFTATFPILLAANFLGTALPHKNVENDYDYLQAKIFSALSDPEDLLLIPVGNIEHYLPLYFERASIKTLHDLGIKNKSSQEGILNNVRLLMAQAKQENKRIFISEEVIDPSPGILDLHHLSPDRMKEFWAPYQAHLKAAAIYKGLSLNRKFGIRSGYRDYRIFELTELP